MGRRIIKERGRDRVREIVWLCFYRGMLGVGGRERVLLWVGGIEDEGWKEIGGLRMGEREAKTGY